MKALELRFLPPVVVALWAAAMALCAWIWPDLTWTLPARLSLAICLTVLGCATGVAGIVAFRKAQTTFNPVRPGKASCVVSTGIFRYTRNPMYLAMLLVLAGWAVYLAHPLGFASLPLFMAYMTRFQIVPEERHLYAKFGAPYAAYLQSVRRWL